jgi:hypothetical protein
LFQVPGFCSVGRDGNEIAINDLFKFENNTTWLIKKLFGLLPGKREISGNAAEWVANNPADFESEHPEY